MTLHLRSTSPPQSFTEPVSRSEMEHALGLPQLSPADAERDALVDSLISASREYAEAQLNLDLVQKQWDLYLDEWPEEIGLRYPLVSVYKVEYTDADGNKTALTEGTDYIVISETWPPVVRPPYGKAWPSATLRARAGILVRFKSGYSASDPYWSDAGARVKSAMKMIAAYWYYNRGASSSEIPSAVNALLAHGAIWR